MTLPIDPEHLPAVVAALQADGVAYLNIGSEPCMCDPDGVDQTHEPFHFAPDEWRALADATCGWCGGTGLEGKRDPHTPCEDCGGTGKQIHTLTVKPSRQRASCAAGCPDCHSVSVDVVVAKLVPAHDADYRPDIDTPYLIIAPSGIFRSDRGSDRPEYEVTPLGPPLQPGDWVARIMR